MEAKEFFQGHGKGQTTILEPLGAPIAKSPEDILEKNNGIFCLCLDTDQTETLLVNKELDKATALDTEAEEWEPTWEQAQDWKPLKARVAGGARIRGIRWKSYRLMVIFCKRRHRKERQNEEGLATIETEDIGEKEKLNED